MIYLDTSIALAHLLTPLRIRSANRRALPAKMKEAWWKIPVDP